MEQPPSGLPSLLVEALLVAPMVPSLDTWMGWMDGWMDHPKRLGAGAFFPHLLSCVCLDRMWLQWVRTLLKIFFEVRKVRKIELESMLHLNGTKALDLVSIM